MRTIVVSAVNIRKGGTLTILRECLSYLSQRAVAGEYRVVALVHQKDLVDYPGIEYIEFPETVRSWGRRLWCEYVTMRKVSQALSPVYLWFSLHDTTPNVKAERQAVYCQTSFPFLKWKLKDLTFDYKIVLFALFTRFAYRMNIRRNRYLVVQAEWLRRGFARMFNLPYERFIVAPPERPVVNIQSSPTIGEIYTFLFAATPDCHKNFEILCQASQLLQSELGEGKFKVILTVKGTENAYASWLHKEWGKVSSIEFAGFMSKQELFANYARAHCLVFPSRIETWGLPISEFLVTGKPMLLADLPYAHETAAGARQVDFFNPTDAVALKEKMKFLIRGQYKGLKVVDSYKLTDPQAHTWAELFNILIND